MNVDMYYKRFESSQENKVDKLSLFAIYPLLVVPVALSMKN